MSVDFVETTEDLSGSPLWNPDLAPTPLSRRTWSTYHIAALWIGMACIAIFERQSRKIMD